MWCDWVGALLDGRVKLQGLTLLPQAVRNPVPGCGFLKLFFVDALVSKNLQNVGGLCLSGRW